MLYLCLLLTAAQLFCASDARYISLKAISIPTGLLSMDRAGSAVTSWQAGSIPGLNAHGSAAIISRKSRLSGDRSNDRFTSTIETTIVNLLPLTLAKKSPICLEAALKDVIADVNKKILKRFVATDRILFNYIIAAQHGDQKVFFNVLFDPTKSMPVPLLADQYKQEWEPGIYATDRINYIALEIHP